MIKTTLVENDYAVYYCACSYDPDHLTRYSQRMRVYFDRGDENSHETKGRYVPTDYM